MKKLKLPIENIPPILIMGIVSSAKDIKLAWDLNSLLNINLVYDKNEEFHLKAGSSELSTFHYSDDVMNYTLVQNKVNNSCLFNELKNIDFLLVISGEKDISILDNIKDRLRNDSLISACIEIPYSQIKRKELFIYL